MRLLLGIIIGIVLTVVAAQYVDLRQLTQDEHVERLKEAGQELARGARELGGAAVDAARDAAGTAEEKLQGAQETQR
jgi:hypothetical protein